MANCDYCNDTNLVAGPGHPPHYVVACSYCEPTVTPLTSIKPGVSPWQGTIMPVPDYKPGLDNGFTVWLEPDVAGERCIVVVPAATLKPFTWTVDGRVTMHKHITSALVELAQSLQFNGINGFDEWDCGAAFEMILPATGDYPLLYHAMPLLALLDGRDAVCLGVRQIHLDNAWIDTQGLQRMPKERITTRITVTEDVLAAACRRFGTEGVIVKQSGGMWGKVPCWSRYRLPEDF